MLENQKQRDVFILGAGFSRAIHNEMPLLKELGELVYHRLPSEELTRLNSSAGFLKDKDVEKLLAYLSQSQPWLREETELHNKSLSVSVIRSITDVLNASIGAVVDTPLDRLPFRLKDFVQYCDRTNACMISMNYDTLIERCAAEIKSTEHKVALECYDFYPQMLVPIWKTMAQPHGSRDPVPSFRLLKLHGSVNWVISSSTSSSPEELVYYVPVEGKWRSNFNIVEAKYLGPTAHRVPFIVPPLVEKTSSLTNTTLKGLWYEAQTYLRYARRIFCIGYSLPQTDLTMQFFLRSNAQKSPVKFYVINRDSTKKISQRYQELLSDVYQIDFKYAGHEDAIKQFASDLIEGKLNDDVVG